MKTRFLKFVLPAFAIMMAIGLAFASEAETVSRIAYYDHPILGVQSTMVSDDCRPGGVLLCKFNGYQLYEEPSLSTQIGKN
ncbi:hypothetical protein MAR621_03034 [Maribacter dokdonensis]|uniref:DUF6520 family protein n=1 Tax=Maribacter dokdonensis TaxID=320912 RepID=UPI001B137ECD|nr:DUF6520 family protein [Maribacter dokdonensis]CAG2532840.1 hypothetical protein MAR621_03034 [Maribacter dokdonensis]